MLLVPITFFSPTGRLCSGELCSCRLVILKDRDTHIYFLRLLFMVGMIFLIFLSPRRVSPFLAWVDFHARSRFARSTIPEEKWGTTRSLEEKWGTTRSLSGWCLVEPYQPKRRWFLVLEGGWEGHSRAVWVEVCR